MSSYVHFLYKTSYSLIRKFHFIVLESTPGGGGGGGGGGYSHTLPIRVCAAQRGRDFEAPGLERGIHFRDVFLERAIIFRTHESSSFVSSHLKLFKDRLLLKIPFNALKNWPISRKGYQS